MPLRSKYFFHPGVEIESSSCRYHHCFAVTKDSEVWAWGKREDGSPGLKVSIDVFVSQSLGDGLATLGVPGKALQVSGGSFHSMLLLKCDDA